jgi:hypothetical protein
MTYNLNYKIIAGDGLRICAGRHNIALELTMNCNLRTRNIVRPNIRYSDQRDLLVSLFVECSVSNYLSV